MFDENIFLSGPHENEMNFYSTSFGKYNPKIIAKIYKELKQIFKDKNFRDETQELYNRQLKNYLRTYYMSYPIAANNPDYMYDYNQERFREFAEAIEDKGYNVYEGFTCPGFWVRRSIDGTSNDFFKLLKLIMYNYDKTFLIENKVKPIKRPAIFDSYQEPIEEDYYNQEEGCSM